LVGLSALQYVCRNMTLSTLSIDCHWLIDWLMIDTAMYSKSDNEMRTHVHNGCDSRGSSLRAERTQSRRNTTSWTGFRREDSPRAASYCRRRPHDSRCLYRHSIALPPHNCRPLPPSSSSVAVTAARSRDQHRPYLRPLFRRLAAQWCCHGDRANWCQPRLLYLLFRPLLWLVLF